MNKLYLAITIALLMLGISSPVLALDNYANPIKITPLLKTTTSWDGKPLVYPQGEAQATGLLVELAEGSETGWHLHPVPSFEVLLQGDLDISLENGQVNHLHEGDVFTEVVNTLHNGKNVGKQPVKILVFYAGTTELPLTIAHPEITKP